MFTGESNPRVPEQRKRSNRRYIVYTIYFFPVEEEAAVTACSAELEGRKIVDRIQEMQKAQKLYDEAITEKQTAFLLEE